MKIGQVINAKNSKEPIYTLPITQELGQSTTDIMSQKAITDNMPNIDKLFKDVSYVGATGIMTFTFNDDTTTTIDLPLELLIESGSYVPATKEIVFVLANGDELKVPVGDLVDEYTADETTLTLTNTTFSVSTALMSTINSKVTSVEGMGLSQESFTTAEKTKLNGIDDGANNYALTTASASVKGGVLIGDGISVTADGTISVDKASVVTIVQTVGDSTTSIMSQKAVTDSLGAIDKEDIGLANVDNTSDLDKPISSATQTALNTKQGTLVSGTSIKTINGETLLGSGDIVIDNAVDSVNGQTGVVVLDKGDVGLINVDNTSDADKPISVATQTALDEKADKSTDVVFTSAQVASGVNLGNDVDISITGEVNDFVISSVGNYGAMQFVAGSAVAFTFPVDNDWAGEAPTFEQGKLYTIAYYKGSWLADGGRNV